jgi:hypothetical protein
MKDRKMKKDFDCSYFRVTHFPVVRMKISLSRVWVGPMLAIPMLLLFGSCGLFGADAPRAARSVHLHWKAPEGELFYNEMTVEQSVPGSYFMAAGWNTGYFGIQELSSATSKLVLFSVWDQSKGNNALRVPVDKRVEVLEHDPDVVIKRFGGEGTGGQCKWNYNWKIGETNRFLVRATVQSNKTAYAAYFFVAGEQHWKHLATFRTITQGSPLKGYYSFVEDFRRDGRSAGEARRARFGNGWMRSTGGDWVALTSARFTASNGSFEAKDHIDAGLVGDEFYLATGGDTPTTTPLNSSLTRQPISIGLPRFDLNDRQR